MIGAIRTRDILAHPLVTIRCFGWRTFLKALTARRQRTFLSILEEAEMLRPPDSDLAGLIARFVALELRAMRIYESLAPRFAQPAAQEFFATLAAAEKAHAEMLSLCQRAGSRITRRQEEVEPWSETADRLERAMREAEAKVRCVHGLADALWLVLEIESSEINRSLLGIVKATDSAFVRQMRSFYSAGTEHLAYIAGGIQSFAPGLHGACERMLALYEAAHTTTIASVNCGRTQSP